MSKENLIIFLLVLCLLISATSAVGVFMFAKKNSALVNEINTVGIAKTTIKPDIAYVNIGVTSSKLTVNEAMNDVNAKLNTVMGALEKLGISSEDMQTASFWVNADYDYQEMPAKIVGYTVTNIIQVKSNPEKISSVISTAAEKGANNFYDLRFEVKDIEEVKASLLPKAIEDAKAKAESLAKASNKKVKDLKVISYDYIPMYSTNYSQGVAGYGGAEAETPVYEGQNEISVKVYVSFELEE